ncbi:unnamed protein product [Durusdinium trenchii]|uniref:30S ribosomal protein S1 n=1 Tax=Durusdinium trenchii TaxID=1381693 RepID=A0ABP0IH97_9DINO
MAAMVASRCHAKARRLLGCVVTAAIVAAQVAAVSFALGVRSASSMTVATLKEKLREKGLPTSGLKAVLVKRLQEAESEGLSGGYSRLTVAQLKAKCSELGLSKLGRKADLVARLEDAASEVNPKDAAAAAGFSVGDKVMALFEEEEEEYEALVQCDNGDETYLISWTEDGFEHTQKAENMRLLKRAERDFGFSAGNKVEGLYHEDNVWYPARVKCINESGTYTIIWEDGAEYEIEEQDLKPAAPLISLADLQPRQRFSGLLKPWFTYEGEEHVFKEGDKVQAFYEDDQDYYEATVQKDHGDGTFLVSWDGDGEEHVAKRTQLKLLRLAELDEGSKVEVLVESVMTDKDGQQKLFLATVEDKIGLKEPRRKVDLSGFEENQWLSGKVSRILPFGAFVQVTSPEGESAEGLLHIREIREGFIANLEDELGLGQHIKVRVKYLNKDEGVLQLSMME